MYKLIVVDDEDVIRKGIAQYIHGADIGFEVVDSFEDGKEAIEYINQNDVDVVLTDIIMTDVSGLEVAEYIYKQKPQIKVVIISGYKEFEYAKKAMEYGVKHYLLKPTKLEDIRLVFGEIKEKLDEERIRENKLLEDSRRYSELLPLLKEQFFIDLVMGAINSTRELDRRMELIGQSEPRCTKCFTFFVEIDNYDEYIETQWQYGKERLGVVLLNFIQGDTKPIQYIKTYIKQNKIEMVAVSKAYENIEDMLSEAKLHFEAVKESIKKYCGLSIRFQIEYSFQNIYELFSFHEPVDAQSSEVFAKSEKIAEKYKLLLSNVSSGSYDEATSIVENFLEEIKHLPLVSIQKAVIDLFEFLQDILSQRGVDKKNIQYEEMFNGCSFTQIRQKCVDALVALIQRTQKNTNTYAELIIQKAKEFIQANYHRDISLEDVADVVYLNHVYFSRFFRQQTGETFTDYLIRIRMEKAIELIRQNNKKIYEISEMVGYKSSKYFIRLFKQYTGFTPKEYWLNQ